MVDQFKMFGLLLEVINVLFFHFCQIVAHWFRFIGLLMDTVNGVLCAINVLINVNNAVIEKLLTFLMNVSRHFKDFVHVMGNFPPYITSCAVSSLKLLFMDIYELISMLCFYAEHYFKTLSIFLSAISPSLIKDMFYKFMHIVAELFVDVVTTSCKTLSSYTCCLVELLLTNIIIVADYVGNWVLSGFASLFQILIYCLQKCSFFIIALFDNICHGIYLAINHIIGYLFALRPSSALGYSKDTFSYFNAPVIILTIVFVFVFIFYVNIQLKFDRLKELMSSFVTNVPNDSDNRDRKHKPTPAQTDLLICVVCQDSKKSIVLLPCKHLCLCVVCCSNIMYGPINRRTCPLCRQRVNECINVYV